jgi:hypothetical protein
MYWKRLLKIFAASFGGTVIGNVLRLVLIDAQEASELQVEGQLAADEKEIVVTGVLTNALIATLLAAPTEKAALLGFFLGAGFTALTGNEPDRRLLQSSGRTPLPS